MTEKERIKKWFSIPGNRERWNARRREYRNKNNASDSYLKEVDDAKKRRDKKRADRKALLASMKPGMRRKFLKKERKARNKVNKIKKIQKASREIDRKIMEAEKIKLNLAQQALKKRLDAEQQEAHRHLVDRAIRKIKAMEESRKLRLTQIGMMSIDVIDDVIHSHNRDKTEEELAVDRAIECVLEMRVSRQEKRNVINSDPVMKVSRWRAA